MKRSLALLLVCLTLSGGTAWGSGSGDAATPLDEIRQVIRERALHPPAESVLQGLTVGNLEQDLQALDPHARYFPAGTWRSPMLGRDAWVGIGADLVFEDGKVILLPYQGGTAALAGIEEGTQLLQVDNASVVGLSPQELLSVLRGTEGSRVALTLLPGGLNAEPVMQVITRQRFRPLDVELLGPPGQRILKVRDFVGGLTRPALLATLEFVLASPRPSGDGDMPLILDLRVSGGGDLFEALDMAALFLPAGAVLGSVQGADGHPAIFHAPPGRKVDIPMVLWVGPDTASAAEVFAGALQHHGRAKVVGRPTFGKCSSQTDVSLSDGSVLRLTNRMVLLPGGERCTAAGIQPDVAVSAAMLRDPLRLLGVSRALLHGRPEAIPAVEREPQIPDESR
ncbi:S41 family peptidase [Ectothiorhodospira lacustris]|uniref:S41 family peptidase n=1 Tax=Ectothiorhodospira lacustris TaxID=2899127 RepID=UPI001EE96C10|nr:S41 family peptidase [Ectothiorhodospira lacustris]MCG5502028.1 S41 family peptidase [Ectothiorhodospira lacustris]